jgi:hypothetical protein
MKNNTLKAFDALKPELRSRAAYFTVGGEDVSSAEHFLLPK